MVAIPNIHTRFWAEDAGSGGSSHGGLPLREEIMRRSPFASLLGLGILIGAVPQALPHSESLSLTAAQVSAALAGNVCTTRAGADFEFSADGRYAYRRGLGFGRTGQYRVGPSSVAVILDNGLGREFKVSIRRGVTYLEDTAITCRSLTLARGERPGRPGSPNSGP